MGSLSLMNSFVCVCVLLYNNFLFALMRMKLWDFLVKMSKVVEESYSVFFWERVIATEQGHSWSIIWWVFLESYAFSAIYLTHVLGSISYTFWASDVCYKNLVILKEKIMEKNIFFSKKKKKPLILLNNSSTLKILHVETQTLNSLPYRWLFL